MSSVPDSFPPNFDYGRLLSDIANAEAQDHAALNDEPAPETPAPTAEPTTSRESAA